MIDMLRIVVLVLGGVVVGIGAPIMWERTRMWFTMGYRTGARAAYLLLVINTLVLTYITFDIIGRYGDALTWRTPLALVIFSLKAVLLYSIREATQEQEDALAREGVIDRRATPRRRRTDTP